MAARALARSDLNYLTKWTIDVTDFGAIANSTNAAAQRLAFDAAIANLVSLGGGILRIPDGTWLLSDPGTTAGCIYLPDAVNIHVQGYGPGNTIIKVADSANGQGVYITRATQCSIRDLTINGNKANQSVSVHCIRIDGTDLDVDNVHLVDAAGYGIGVAQSNSAKFIRLSRVTTEGSVTDGIDIKNKHLDNESVFLDQIFVKTAGLGGPTEDANLEKTGIDIRGPAQLSNIYIASITEPCVGVRFRYGESADTNGIGGHKSTLTNFRIIGPTSAGTTIGVDCPCRDVEISNGYIYGCNIGLQLGDSGSKVSNVHSDGAVTNGFKVTQTLDGTTRVGTRTVLTACEAVNGAGDGFRISTPRVTLVAPVAWNNAGYGLKVTSDGVNATIVAPDFNGNTSGPVSDSGTDTFILASKGTVTGVKPVLAGTDGTSSLNMVGNRFLWNHNAAVALGSGGTSPWWQAHGLGNTYTAEGRYRWSADTSPYSINMVKSRGTAVSDFAAVQSGDALGEVKVWASTGSDIAAAGRSYFAATGDWSSGATRSSDFRIEVATAGTLTNYWRFKGDGTFTDGAGNVILFGDYSYRSPSKTVATLPSPSSGSKGRQIWASDGRAYEGGVLQGVGSGTGVLVTCNGSAWVIAGTNDPVQA